MSYEFSVDIFPLTRFWAWDQTDENAKVDAENTSALHLINYNKPL